MSSLDWLLMYTPSFFLAGVGFSHLLKLEFFVAISAPGLRNPKRRNAAAQLPFEFVFIAWAGWATRPDSEQC